MNWLLPPAALLAILAIIALNYCLWRVRKTLTEANADLQKMSEMLVESVPSHLRPGYVHPYTRCPPTGDGTGYFTNSDDPDGLRYGDSDCARCGESMGKHRLELPG
jgi:hypothetical protein